MRSGRRWQALLCALLVAGLAVPARAETVTKRVDGWNVTLTVEPPAGSEPDDPDEGGMEPGQGTGPGTGVGPGAMGGMLLDNQEATHHVSVKLTGPAGANVRLLRLIAVRRQGDQAAMTLLRPTPPGVSAYQGRIRLPAKGAYVLHLRFLPIRSGTPEPPKSLSFDLKY